MKTMILNLVPFVLMCFYKVSYQKFFKKTRWVITGCDWKWNMKLILLEKDD